MVYGRQQALDRRVWMCLHITPLYVLLHYRMIRDTLSGAVKVSRDERHLHEFHNLKETASCCLQILDQCIKMFIAPASSSTDSVFSHYAQFHIETWKRRHGTYTELLDVLQHSPASCIGLKTLK
jgi:hypothetical protein